MLALAGCAQEGVRPAYLGLSDLTVRDAPGNGQSVGADNTPDVIRHIQSNKVLGAMAFQKTTGQAVDPDSLLRRDSE
jgi:hypothetical protein